MNTQIQVRSQVAIITLEKLQQGKGVGEKWRKSEQGKLHGGGDIGAEAGSRKEKKAGKRAASSRKTIPHKMGPYPG